MWTRDFDYADLDNQVAATDATRYRIASVTKLFTSTAILILRGTGMLQLDDLIDRHLSWFEIRQRYPETLPITILHLLTHTAGLPREAEFPYRTDASCPAREQVREDFPRQETAYPAETRWKYPNLALVLTGEIVGDVSSQGYKNFVQQRILGPLGMSNTLVKPPHPNSRLAVGYGRGLPSTGSAVHSSFTDYRGITSAANMTSTVADLAKFVML